MGAGLNFAQGSPKNPKPTYERWGNVVKSMFEGEEPKAKSKGFTSQDIVSMFKGEGKLAT